jgi:hypothetical protein
MPTDSTWRFQALLAELETLDEGPVGDLDIRTRRSEILQSILQLFAMNAQDEREGLQFPGSEIQH